MFNSCYYSICSISQSNSSINNAHLSTLVAKSFLFIDNCFYNCWTDFIDNIFFNSLNVSICYLLNLKHCPFFNKSLRGLVILTQFGMNFLKYLAVVGLENFCTAFVLVQIALLFHFRLSILIILFSWELSFSEINF